MGSNLIKYVTFWRLLSIGILTKLGFRYWQYALTWTYYNLNWSLFQSFLTPRLCRLRIVFI